MSILDKFVIDEKLKRSIIQSVSRMYYNHDWKEGQTRNTKKYSITYRFSDQGANFLVTNLSTGKEYYVNAHVDYGWAITKKGTDSEEEDEEPTHEELRDRHPERFF